MQSYIYKSLNKNELYLYLDKKDDFSKIPVSLLKNLGRMEFVMELEITPERKLAREDVNKVMTSLLNKGFFVQMPPTVIPEVLRFNNSTLH